MKYLKIWLLGSMALAGLSFLIWMTTASAEPTTSSPATSTSTCNSIVATANAGTNIPEPRGSVAYQQKWLTLHNLIVGNPECFPANIVAGARANLQSYLTH